MRRLIISAFALAIAAAPGAVSAQDPAGAGHPGKRGAHGARIGERLIEHREELGLSIEQVAQIRRIQAQLAEQNAPLVEQLQAAHGTLRQQRGQLSEEERAQHRARMQEQMAGQRARLQERRAQMDSVRQRAATMTAEQRAQLRTDMQARMRAQGTGLPGRNRPVDMLPAELQPVAEQLRQNTENAVRQIEETLTAEQRAKLRSVLPGPRRGQAGPLLRRRGAER